MKNNEIYNDPNKVREVNVNNRVVRRRVKNRRKASPKEFLAFVAVVLLLLTAGAVDRAMPSDTNSNVDFEHYNEMHQQYIPDEVKDAAMEQATLDLYSPETLQKLHDSIAIEYKGVLYAMQQTGELQIESTGFYDNTELNQETESYFEYLEKQKITYTDYASLDESGRISEASMLYGSKQIALTKQLNEFLKQKEIASGEKLKDVDSQIASASLEINNIDNIKKQLTERSLNIYFEQESSKSK